MAKNKSAEIPHYELLYLISNKYSEDELAPIMDKVRKMINDQSGNITFSEEWGKKRLAYPIKRFRYGYYNLVEFDLAGEKLVLLDKAMRLTREILRHQIVKKKKKTIEKIKKEKMIAEKIAARKEKQAIQEKDKEKDIDKVKLKDLDKKLDKILETDDLL